MSHHHASMTVDEVVAANVRGEMARVEVKQAALVRLFGRSQSAVSRRLRGVTPFAIRELVILSGFLQTPLDVLLVGLTEAKR